MNKLQERVALVLVEHFFHNAEFHRNPGGKWAIQCNCDEIVQADSHGEVELAFAEHQAAAIGAIFL